MPLLWIWHPSLFDKLKLRVQLLYTRNHVFIPLISCIFKIIVLHLPSSLLSPFQTFFLSVFAIRIFVNTHTQMPTHTQLFKTSPNLKKNLPSKQMYNEVFITHKWDYTHPHREDMARISGQCSMLYLRWDNYQSSWALSKIYRYLEITPNSHPLFEVKVLCSPGRR